MNMGLMLRQNMEQRQRLMQKLELVDTFLESALVRTEAKLREDREAQKALALIKYVRGAEDYHCILDWLLAVFVPSMRPDIQAHYENNAPRLIQHRPWALIDLIDRKMVVALEMLKRFRLEMLQQGWKHGGINSRGTELTQLTAAQIDLLIVPLFPVVQPFPQDRKMAVEEAA
jgi:hypothetical protein